MTTNALDIVDEADEKVLRWKNYVRPAAEYFHEHEGELFERAEILNRLSEHLGTNKNVTADVLSALISDTVDPVVQVPTDESRYVGVVEYNEFDGAYGYLDFDDVLGKRRRVVCAKCVKEADFDKEVKHATAGDPHGSFDDDATYEELVEGVHKHYENVHDSIPCDVETGATLASGTTIGGNISFHAGNDGDGSGLDADMLDGNESSAYETSSTFSIETSNRDIDTWYENTTGNPLFVVVSVFGGDTTIRTKSYVNTVKDETDSRVSIERHSEDTNTDESASGIFIVPDGYYYKVEGIGGINDASLQEWTEWQIK